MHMRLRSQNRQTRQYHKSELPKYVSVTDSESESEFEFESDDSRSDNSNEDESSVSLASSTTIPELNINEIIQLANQIINNNHIPTTSSNITENDPNIHIRFPLIRSINEARDTILQHEQQRTDHIINDNTTSNLNVINDDIIWNSIIEDESGISISGTLRQHIDTDGDESIPNMEDIHTPRQPVWLEIAGLITVTMFMFVVYRLVTALVAMSAFSDNVLQDVIEFVDYVNEKSYYTEYAAGITNDLLSSTVTPESDTLIKKFAIIIKREMPYLPDTIWLTITVTIFSGYTIFTSGIILTSLLFSVMCLSMCCVIRWRHLGDFIMRVIAE